MITALDHVVLLCPEIEAGVAAYETLLGAAPVWRAEGSGTAQAVFKLNNTALELMAPHGAGEVADKLGEMTADGARLTSLAFRTEDLSAVHPVLSRRGLDPSEINEGESTDQETGAQRTWARLRVPDAKMAGIKTFVLEPKTGALPEPVLEKGSAVALDHLVINTPNPDRAVANYAGRLDLRLALDRSNADWGVRLLFFRTGGLTLEVMQRLGAEEDPSGQDTIWGMTWAVENLEAAHQRLSKAGLNVSDRRTGRRPGSEVFTVRDGTLGIPTLFIAHQKE